LKITGVESIDGEASIAVSRGEPRMGYELNFKLELTGLYYLDGLLCTINIEEFCDDQGDPESATISITKL
jgi:hypothetical protein